jgi:hypothetical protein
MASAQKSPAPGWPGFAPNVASSVFTAATALVVSRDSGISDAAPSTSAADAVIHLGATALGVSVFTATGRGASMSRAGCTALSELAELAEISKGGACGPTAREQAS